MKIWENPSVAELDVALTASGSYEYHDESVKMEVNTLAGTKAYVTDPECKKAVSQKS